MASGKAIRVMDVRGALKEAMARLREADVPSHALAAELLLMHTLGRNRAWLYAHPEAPLDAAADERFFELVARRATGTPTQYLTGRQEFWGLEFEVAAGVLIPRPETEHVVEVALARLGKKKSSQRLRIADVGTGTGCLAVALACELPAAEVIATDISAVALAVAGRNARRHRATNRIHFVQCNLLDAFLRAPAEPFGLIVSNPPYVGRSEADLLPREIREHEPAEALFSGPTGLEIYEPLIAQAKELLVGGGILVLELGYGAGERVRALLDACGGWKNISVTNDLAGTPRVLAAERP